MPGHDQFCQTTFEFYVSFNQTKIFMIALIDVGDVITFPTNSLWTVVSIYLEGMANCRNTLRRLHCNTGIVVTGAVRQIGLRGRGQGRDSLAIARRLHPGTLIG